MVTFFWNFIVSPTRWARYDKPHLNNVQTKWSQFRCFVYYHSRWSTACHRKQFNMFSLCGVRYSCQNPIIRYVKYDADTYSLHSYSRKEILLFAQASVISLWFLLFAYSNFNIQIKRHLWFSMGFSIEFNGHM